MAVPPPVPDAVVEDELAAQPGLGLRAKAARGTLVNGGFIVSVHALGVLRGIVVAGLLTVAEYGVWGLLTAAYGTLAWLAAIGLDDKYIQQDHPDQEEAFQIAFTLQCLLCACFTGLALAAIPVFALLYDAPEMIGPGLVLAAALPAVALQTPLWVFVRRLEFMRQRRLQIWDPVVSFVVAIVLAAFGLGVWALVIATLAGVWTAAVVAVRASPYPLRFRRSAFASLREYAEFSWPLFLGSASAVAAGQVPLLIASRRLGTAAVGAITLATTLAMFAHRVDEVITGSMYPAIARARDDARAMWEAFSMSNRLALLWAAPFGAGAVLFSEDLVVHLLGERWLPAVPLMQFLGAAAALNQIAFNWTAFFRAHSRTRPIAVAQTVMLAAVLAIAVPLLIDQGLEGYGLGWLIATVLFVAVRLGFVATLFPAPRVAADVGRALAPTVPALAAVLLVRAAGGARGPVQALVEVCLFGVVAVAATVLLERRLLATALALLRKPAG